MVSLRAIFSPTHSEARGKDKGTAAWVRRYKGFLGPFLGAPLLCWTLLAFPSGQACDPLTESQDSDSCLGCHDGTLAPNMLNSPTVTLFGTMGLGLEKSHPVAIDYARAYLDSEERLRAPSALNSAVRLHNGEVECTTCHTCAEPTSTKLVMSNAGSRLCFSCHIL